MQLLTRIKVFCNSFRPMATKVSYHSSFLIQLLTVPCTKSSTFARVLFHTQWNLVVVIIKCKLLGGYRGKLEARAINIIDVP